MQHLTYLACLLLVVAAVSLSTAQPQGTYTTKYDNINLDEVLNNERLYRKYFSCLVNKGKCTPDGKELKDVLPDALSTQCSKCSPRQKEGTEKVLKFLLTRKPADYETLEKIYDPTGIYRKRYEGEARRHGINLKP